MQRGVMSFNREYSIRAGEPALAGERRGFVSVWFPEHTHIPASSALHGQNLGRCSGVL
jgi:alkanesulfonate monooxygenase SsuD/methylene tetrahydromethanopterin reductase-like flavin-dependent oxidoreductase (luciferase family)